MAESRTAVLAALLGNGALTLLKGVSAAATGSAAMLAETFHSAADTGNQGLLLLGGRLAHRPSEHHASLWTWAVLGGGFLFEVISLGVAVRSLRAVLRGRSLRRYWRENRDPTLTTVVLEDSAALTSLVVAGLGIWLSGRLGSPLPDALASGVIGLILLCVAVFLAFENYSLLIGEAAPGDVEAAIRVATSGDPDVRRVADVHTMHLGPTSILIVLGVHFRPGLDTRAMEGAVQRIHERVRRAVGNSTRPRLIVVEPRASEEADVAAA